MANVLILEDEITVKDLFAAVLRRDGHTVWGVMTAVEAERICQLNEIDLLVADIVLAGDNGTTSALRIVNLYPRVRVVFVSGYPMRWKADTETNMRRMPPRSYSVLHKPISPRHLSAAVQEMLRKQRQQDFARMLRSSPQYD